MKRSTLTRRALLATALLATIALTLASTIVVGAHGASIEYISSVGIELTATYDSGTVMSEAQVFVYAPNDPATVWLTGMTDEQGRFFFTPDPDIPGTYTVQVRQAGHGAIVHIPVGEGSAASGGSGLTTVQIILMSASIVWGFIGTALYFSGRNA